MRHVSSTRHPAAGCLNRSARRSRRGERQRQPPGGSLETHLDGGRGRHADACRRTRRAGGARPARGRHHDAEARRRGGEGAERRRACGSRPSRPRARGVALPDHRRHAGLEHRARHDQPLRRAALLGRRQVADRAQLHGQARQALDAEWARRQQPRHAPDAEHEQAPRSRAPVSTRASRGVRVSLTAAAAKALNATFSTTLFKRGLRLGTVSLTAQADHGRADRRRDHRHARRGRRRGAAEPRHHRRADRLGLARVPDHRRARGRQDVRGHDHAQRRHLAHEGRDEGRADRLRDRDRRHARADRARRRHAGADPQRRPQRPAVVAWTTARSRSPARP